jgi:Pyruvate/2-oxoacid:ferredoxin oxidoreductase delta subunit
MKELGIQAVPFTETLQMEAPDGRVFRHMDLAGEVFAFDRVINLAKLKTHTQMVLTLAVKNLFGTIVGANKAMWHLKAGKDYDTFATVLVQILEAVKPTVSIIDGILGMEGDGPSFGSPRHVGIVAASSDAVALDATVCRLLGFPVNTLRTCVVGDSMGVGVTDSDRIGVVGDELDGFPLRDFKLPKSATVAWNLSSRNPARRFLENHVITRPAIDDSACSLCKICLDHCPPAAICERDGKMVIDYRKCISCFCCQEICSSDAVRVVQPRLGRFLSKITR